MADLIERLNDAWRRLYADGDKHGVRDTIAEAAAALEAAREDAGRYRHLRSNESSGAVDLCICRIEWSHKSGAGRARYEVIAEERADAAIDQARGKGVA